MSPTEKQQEREWKKIEKELEYVATYASPERREELLRFLKHQFQSLLASRAEMIRGMKTPHKGHINYHTTNGYNQALDSAAQVVLSGITETKE